MSEDNNQEMIDETGLSNEAVEPREETKKERNARYDRNNANTIKNAAEVLAAIPEPTCQAIGQSIKAVDKMTGGKASEMAGKNLRRLGQFGGTLGGPGAFQKASNVLNESGLGDKIGQGASLINSANGNGAPKTSSGSTNNANSPTTKLPGEEKNNSGFKNNKSGLFSPSSNSAGRSSAVSGDLGQSLNKAKKIMGIIGAVAPIVFPIIIVVLIVAAIMSQIMVAVEFLGEVETGIEKYVNFAQGHGWLTNEEYFFKHLENEYDNFSITVSEGELDIPLIAATIHYSKVVDTDVLGDIDVNDDKEYTNDDFESLGQFLGGDQTASFYNIAADKLGSVNTLFPGQKRLLGHVVETEITIERKSLKDLDEAFVEWQEIINLVNQIIESTLGDSWEHGPIASVLSLPDAINTLIDYKNQNGDSLAGLKYDVANQFYELQEVLFMLETQILNALENLSYDSEGNITLEQLLSFPTPVLNRRANYGYDEYKQMKEDILEIKSVLSNNGVDYKNDEDALKQAEKSSNTELKQLYNSYKTNELNYKYSYTHYLKTIYIPFTYFYGKEYTTQQVDAIVDEIYDQRDFYNYLVKEETNNSCDGTCEYSVDGKKISNLKVRLLQCSDGDLGQPIPGEELIDFEQYILGVVYAEIGADAPVEAAKAQAIAARSYALTRARVMGNKNGLKLEKENGIWILSIRNCTEDQVYCDPNRGCSNTTNPSESGNSTTVYSGATTKQYKYKGPLTEDSKIRTAVNSVSGIVLLDENNGVVVAGYTNQEQTKWTNQANSGMDYTEILLGTYERVNSISASSCSNVCNKATGDYTQWKQFGSPWSSIEIAPGNNIGNIGCLVTSLAIQVARSGVPVNINGEFNPGTFVQALKRVNAFSGGGALYSWDSVTAVAPSFVLHSDINLSNDTQTTKASKVQQLITQGCYVVMEVKSAQNMGQHWVAVDYVSGNRVYMMDPASTEVDTWKKYPHAWTSRAVCFKVSN